MRKEIAGSLKRSIEAIFGGWLLENAGHPLILSYIRHILNLVRTIMDRLRNFGITPTPQRIAVAEFVLNTAVHPTAHEVWMHVRNRCPTTSRATVYNSLNLFAEKGLLKPQQLREGVVVFDPHVKPHHHFIDEDTGKVIDIPWEALRVRGEKSLKEYEVREYQVVMRGKKRR